MIKPHINTLILLACAFSVYAHAQDDWVLPVIAGTVIVVSVILRLKTPHQFPMMEQIPWLILGGGCLFLGFLWRQFVPIPAYASTHLPMLVSAAQSALVLAATLIALRPLTQNNRYGLAFCAWLIVPLSLDVPFSPPLLLSFAAFTFVAMALIIVHTMHAPQDPAHKPRYARDYALFSGVLAALTTGLFFVISSGIVSLETAFYNTMSGYILPRHYTHFLNISRDLQLIAPGMSGTDRRPLLEIQLPQRRAVYLKMQVFDRYRNGVWSETPEPLDPLPGLQKDQPTGTIVMFTGLKNLVPMPGRISGVKSANGSYLTSAEEVVRSTDNRRSHVLEFSLSPSSTPVKDLSAEEHQKYTAVPSSIAETLRDISRTWVSPATDHRALTLGLTGYFHRNFSYSLNVRFAANDWGLVQMLRQERPAYCTYFASALALMLRAHGIPARVAAGFLTTEQVGPHRFLARVYNAHAWTEVLLPTALPDGTRTLEWQIFDATPPSFQTAFPKTVADHLQTAFETAWLHVLRWRVRIENLDQNVLEVYAVLALAALFLGINSKRIWNVMLSLWRRNKPRPAAAKPKGYLRRVYNRYEEYLRKTFSVVRRPCETDQETVNRISPQLTPQTLSTLLKFVQEFQAVRFGGKPKDHLEHLLEELVKNESK